MKTEGKETSYPDTIQCRLHISQHDVYCLCASSVSFPQTTFVQLLLGMAACWPHTQFPSWTCCESVLIGFTDSSKLFYTQTLA